MSISFSQEDPLFNFVVKEGNGIKGLVDSGLNNVPQHYIQPPQHRINKKDAIHSLATTAIDLSELDGPKHDQVVKAIAEAPPYIVLDKHQNRWIACAPTWGAGKIPAFYLRPNLWHRLESREAAVEYIRTSKELVRKLLEVLISNLGVTLEDSRLDELMATRMVQMNFYPPCPNPELTVGVGRHSDIGLLTVLLQDGIGGLHVKTQGGNEEWIEIPPIPGALVINVGDTLEILSNGRYRSAEHRAQTTSVESRVSIPIFNAPTPATKIGPFPELVEGDGVARYREVSFGEYTNNFFNHAHEGKKSLEFALNSNST